MSYSRSLLLMLCLRWKRLAVLVLAVVALLIPPKPSLVSVPVFIHLCMCMCLCNWVICSCICLRVCVCADQQVYAVQRQRYLAHQRNIQDSAPVHINSNGTDEEEEEDDGSGYHVSNTDAYSGTRALEKQQQQDSFDDYSGRLDGGEEQEYDNGREDVRGLTEEDKTIKVRTPVHAYMHMHTNTNERKHNVIHTTHIHSLTHSLTHSRMHLRTYALSSLRLLFFIHSFSHSCIYLFLFILDKYFFIVCCCSP